MDAVVILAGSEREARERLVEAVGGEAAKVLRCAEFRRTDVLPVGDLDVRPGDIDLRSLYVRDCWLLIAQIG